MNVETIPFEKILPVWKYYLWPGRDNITSMSSMTYLVSGKSTYNVSIYDRYDPTYFAVFNGKQIIGVNSGFRTNDYYYRSRGIWVDPEYRGKNLSQILFHATQEQAIKEKCLFIWSIPRKEALPAYEKFGFMKTSDWIDDGMEYGPNCYVLKFLKYKGE